MRGKKKKNSNPTSESPHQLSTTHRRSHRCYSRRLANELAVSSGRLANGLAVSSGTVSPHWLYGQRSLADLAAGTAGALPGAGAGRLAGHPRAGLSLPWHGRDREAPMRPGCALAARPWDGTVFLLGYRIRAAVLGGWCADGDEGTFSHRTTGRYGRVLSSPCGS
jgi:hypothetical protein